MKSNTIASEKKPVSYVKLKKIAIDIWYLPDLKMNPLAKRKLPKELIKREFRIDAIAFFKKHVWYHFIIMNTERTEGWIRYKFIRRNYCRLDVIPIMQINKRDVLFAGDLTSIMMTLSYYGKNISYYQLTQLISVMKSPLKRDDLFNIFVKMTGSFQDLTGKTFRRIMHQLLRCHPVIMWIASSDRISSIVLVGFNHHIFFYNDPRTGKLGLISKGHLNRLWKRAGSFAISY